MTKGRFKFEKLVKYPHMKPADISVWQRFIEKHPDFFERVDYDFCVGEGAEFLPTDEATPDGRENRLYRRKIDVVGYKENAIYIIEVKPDADMKALGQVLTLATLYTEQEKPTEKIILAVIAEKLGSDMLETFKLYKIEVIIV